MFISESFFCLLALTDGDFKPVSSSECSITSSISSAGSSIIGLVSGESWFACFSFCYFFSVRVVRRFVHIFLVHSSVKSLEPVLTSRVFMIWKTSLVRSIKSKPLGLSIIWKAFSFWLSAIFVVGFSSVVYFLTNAPS